MKKHHFICTIAVLLAMVANVQAQEERNKSLINSYLHGWEYNIKAGFNIGGTSPIPLPKEIRKIDSYAPGIAIAIEGNATKWFDEKKKWGLTLGLRLENKNMTTEATVKNYGMKIINTNGGELAGLWTGGVKTKVKNSYLTIPILADYRISKRWIVSAGPYFSYLLEGNFSGHVYEGHLRTPDQTISPTSCVVPVGYPIWGRMESVQASHRACRCNVGIKQYLPERLRYDNV